LAHAAAFSLYLGLSGFTFLALMLFLSAPADADAHASPSKIA